jgi:hypothetical protein
MGEAQVRRSATASHGVSPTEGPRTLAVHACRMKAFGAEQGRKEFEALLNMRDTTAGRLLVYREWAGSARSARKTLQTSTSKVGWSATPSDAYLNEELRVLQAASEEFPGERYVSLHWTSRSGPCDDHMLSVLTLLDWCGVE